MSRVIRSLFVVFSVSNCALVCTSVGAGSDQPGSANPSPAKYIWRAAPPIVPVARKPQQPPLLYDAFPSERYLR